MARKRLLKANALYLFAASIGGLLLFDVGPIFFASGPPAQILNGAPDVGVRFLESPGPALILAVLFWRAPAIRSWHLTAAAVHGLLGTASQVCWGVFIASGTLPMSYITTSLHGLFATLQVWVVFSGQAGAEFPEQISQPVRN